MARGFSGGFGFGIILLALELFRVGLPNIPPVTLGFIAFNSAIHLRLLRLVRNVHYACVSYRHVVQLGQWKRVCLASFYHLSSMHLYYNMVSFLWKGRTLERRFGSRKFFIIILLFAVLSQLLLLLMSRVLSILMWNSSYQTTCAAGFSAVIFGLKVLTTQNMWQESVSVMGLPITIPAQFACWVELVLIHILVPGASFLGHLAGILVGMAFANGPLKSLVEKVDSFLAVQFGEIAAAAPNRGPAYTYRAAATGYRAHNNHREEVHPDGSEEQQIREAIRRSLLDRNARGLNTDTPTVRHRHQMTPAYGWNIPHMNEDISSGDQNVGQPQRDGDQSHHETPYPPTGYNLYGPGRYNSAPYPVDDNAGMPQPQGGIYPNLRDVQSGIQSPSDMQSPSSVPSAPPLPSEGLFSVD